MYIFIYTCIVPITGTIRVLVPVQDTIPVPDTPIHDRWGRYGTGTGTGSGGVGVGRGWLGGIVYTWRTISGNESTLERGMVLWGHRR